MIVLGILMFAVLFFLYKFLLGTQRVVVSNLKYDESIKPFSFSGLSIPNSTRYSYYIWVYVNKIDPSVDENIFTLKDSRTKNPVATADKEIFKLYIKNTTDLYVEILKGSDTTRTKYLMASNFPLQSWQQIIISFDNTHLDFYHNGKFIKSLQFKNTELPVKTSTTSIIEFGTNKPDINIKLFDRYDYPMDPQTAWNKYIQDSKTSSGSNTVNYGLNLNLSTNNKPSTPIKLF